ncbi:MAG: hypothetical protein WCE50_06120 [Candidatus Acidiferrum sp.]
MKSQSLSSAVLTTRCSHRTASGRQCRQLSADQQSRLCAYHLSKQKAEEVDNLTHALLLNCQNFQTAQGVNFALANIYRLLAANRISTRRASVLAYINSLLLRTLPAIDYDYENGHTDPTAPKEEQTDEDSSTREEDAEESCATAAPPSNTYAEAAQGWDASIPEPDPTKKPS